MILVLTGKSSSGKDTILKELVNKNICTGVISSTSRPIRENEKNKVDYYFCTKEQFIQKIENGELIEHRTYNTNFNGNSETWYYGTEKSSIDISKDSCLVLDVQGLKDIREYFKDEQVIGIYLHCPEKLRTERAKKRGSFCSKEWKRRLKTDKVDFENVYSEVDYVINSAKDTSELIDEIKGILCQVMKN